jgi:hypothetical protein
MVEIPRRRPSGDQRAPSMPGRLAIVVVAPPARDTILTSAVLSP